MSSTSTDSPSTSSYPPHFSLSNLIRPNILSLAPYRCARDDYQSGILLDANENSIGTSIPSTSTNSINQFYQNGSTSSTTTPTSADSASDSSLSLHRYPDPSLYNLKQLLCNLRNVKSTDNVFLGVGSDEVLDLIQRITANPGKDSICICPPTYGMYAVGAAVNDLNVVKVPLKVQGGEFSLDVEKLNQTLSSDHSIKVLFLCSPGNPTGTLLSLSSIVQVLENPNYKGLVVVDEAYIDFALEEIELFNSGERKGYRDLEEGEKGVSAISLIEKYSNLIVTQTLSKAFGLAGVRLGMAFSQPSLIQIMNNTKAPYNISTPTAYLSSLSLSSSGTSLMKSNIQTLLQNRRFLISQLPSIPAIGQILGDNHSNFVLVQVLGKEGGKPDGNRAEYLYKKMAEEQGVVVRNRSKELGCEGCLRITVGTMQETKRCLELMKEILEEKWGA